MNFKSFALVLPLLIFSIIIHAQQTTIDSLEQQLKSPSNGLSKVEILNELSWYYALSNTEKGLDRANSAITLALKTKDSFQLGLAYERKGFNYQNMGKDSMTLALYDVAEDIYKKIGHSQRLAALTFNKGNFYFFRSNYTKSLIEGEKALRIFIDKKDSVRMSRVYNQIALNHLYLGNYKNSLEAFQKGQLMLELTNNRETQFYAEILGNTALLHEKLSEFKKALEIQNQALAIHKKIDYPLGISNTYSNIGKLYSHIGQHEKALEMLNASMKIKEEMGNPYRIANGMTNLGIAYSELKLYPKAVEKLTKAKNIFEELEHFTNLSTVCKNLGDIHLELSQPHRAILEFESAITYSKKNDDKRAEYLAKEGLSKALFYVSNYKKAYLLQSEFIKLRDSVLSTEKRDEIASLKAKYEYDKERAVLEANFEKDKALDQAKIKQQVLIRNTAIGGGAIGMVALIVGFILVKRKKEAEFNEILTSSKLQTIRAQLNPHFIFNTLNSINDYIQRNDKETASNFLVRFSKMIRTVLDHSKEIEVSLDEEITFLENYVKLEQQRLNDGFTFTISVDDQINTEETLIPPSLIQPFVENSIWHGLSQKENGEGELSISISKNGEMLLCAIEDNGTGITNGKVSKPNHHKSFGTISAQNRLDILNDIKGNSKTKIQFIEKDEGIRVEIKIPFHLDTDI